MEEGLSVSLSEGAAQENPFDEAAAGRFGALDRHAADARIDPHDQSRFRVQNAYDRR
jgi:hypothetical protein